MKKNCYISKVLDKTVEEYNNINSQTDGQPYKNTDKKANVHIEPPNIKTYRQKTIIHT